MIDRVQFNFEQRYAPESRPSPMAKFNDPERAKICVRCGAEYKTRSRMALRCEPCRKAVRVERVAARAARTMPRKRRKP